MRLTLGSFWLRMIPTSSCQLPSLSSRLYLSCCSTLPTNEARCFAHGLCSRASLSEFNPDEPVQLLGHIFSACCDAERVSVPLAGIQQEMEASQLAPSFWLELLARLWDLSEHDALYGNILMVVARLAEFVRLYCKPEIQSQIISQLIPRLKNRSADDLLHKVKPELTALHFAAWTRSARRRKFDSSSTPRRQLCAPSRQLSQPPRWMIFSRTSRRP